MEYSSKIEELVYLYNNKLYDELIEKLLEYNDPILDCPFKALFSLASGQFDRAKEDFENFDFTSYYAEEYDSALKFACNIASKANCLNKVEEICHYFYNKSNDIKMLFPYLDLKVGNCYNFDECRYDVNTIIEHTRQYTRFSYKTQYFIFYGLYYKDDYNALFNFALEADEKFQIDNNIHIRNAELAFNKSNYNFLVDYYEKLMPFIEYRDLDDYRFHSLCIQSKDILYIELTFEELNILTDYLSFTVDNYKILLKYVNKYRFDRSVVELLKILDGEDLNIENNVNMLFKKLINYDIEDAVKYSAENGFYPDYITQLSYCLKSYDENIKMKLFDYLVELYNDNRQYAYYYFFAIERAIDSKYFEDFENLLSRIDLENEMEIIKARLSKHVDKVEQRYYLYYYGQGLLNISKNETVILYAKTFLLAWYYYTNEKENFISMYEEIKNDVSFCYSSIMVSENPRNKDLFSYLLDQKDKNLALHYNNAIADYLYTKKDVRADLKFVGKIISVLEKLFEQYGEELNVSKNCFDSERGIYHYYIGELSKAEEIITACAYASERHCNCGVGRLLTLNDFKYGDKSYEMNKKIVLNSVNGFKLVGEDEYIKDDFINNIDIYCYYAYYALLGDKDFQIETALKYLLNKNQDSVQSGYFIIKLAYELGKKHVIEEHKRIMKEYLLDDAIEYDLKYTEVLNNIECSIYKPQTFYKTLFRYVL